ncbi:general Secretory Pathway D, type II secretion system domain protein [Burkholderia mallei]|nr:general Secretory Pathway D, type II secretion system domain protein [Burkholderia mallei]
MQPTDVQAIRDRAQRPQRAARIGHGSRRQIDDAVAEAGLPRHQIGARIERVVRNLPLNAQIGAGRRLQLDDQRLDVHLRAPRIELVDHGPQIPVYRIRRGDDERIRRRVRLDHSARLVVVALVLVAAEQPRIAEPAAARRAARAAR